MALFKVPVIQQVITYYKVNADSKVHAMNKFYGQKEHFDVLGDSKSEGKVRYRDIIELNEESKND